MDLTLRCLQSSKNTSRLRLKVAEHPVSFNDIEEIDLADERLEVESAHTTPRQYLPTPDALSIEDKPGSVRISKKPPQFSYASGLQPDQSLIGHYHQDNRSSPDFPLPSVLLGNEDPFEYNLELDSEALFPILPNDRFELPAFADTAVPPPIGSLEQSAFHFNAFEALETAQLRNFYSNKKRPACSSPIELEAKIRRVFMDDEGSKFVEGEGLPKDEVVLDVQAKKPLPDWVAEFDQDLIAFFGDSVEYKAE